MSLIKESPTLKINKVRILRTFYYLRKIHESSFYQKTNQLKILQQLTLEAELLLKIG
jgi:hypothetical protein